MKKPAKWVTISALFFGVLSVRSQTSQPRIALSIQNYPSPVKAGSRIFITIEVVNLAKDGMIVDVASLNGIDPTYRYDIRDQDGRLLPQIKLNTLDVAYDHIVQLDPSKRFPRRVPISDLCDMTLPEKYTVQVWRADDQQNVVKSNAITITVVP